MRALTRLRASVLKFEVGLDKAGNSIYSAAQANGFWTVLVVQGSRLVAMAARNLKREDATKMAQYTVKNGTGQYWSSATPIKDFYLNA